MSLSRALAHPRQIAHAQLAVAHRDRDLDPRRVAERPRARRPRLEHPGRGTRMTQRLRPRKVEKEQIARIAAHDLTLTLMRMTAHGCSVAVRTTSRVNAGRCRGPSCLQSGSMRIGIALASLALLLLAPAVARGSLADELRQGQQLAAQLQSGAKRCSDVSAEDFDHIGEYVMGRAVGSPSLHQAMNGRMSLMMGEQADSRVHELLGANFAGCRAPAGTGRGYGDGGMTGPGMMGGVSGGWGVMMSSGAWSWMMNGAWRNMTRAEWRELERRLLGTNRSSDHHGWSTLAIVAITTATTLLAAAIVILLIRHGPRRRPPAAAAT